MRNLKFEGILLKAGMRQSSSLSTCHVNTVLDAVGAATRQKKEAKYITRKRRSQMKISLGAQEFYQEIPRSNKKKKYLLQQCARIQNQPGKNNGFSIHQLKSTGGNNEQTLIHKSLKKNLGDKSN